MYNLGFHSLLKYVDASLPHSSEECSLQLFSVSFPQVDSNSAEHWEPMYLLWDSLLPLGYERNRNMNFHSIAEENSLRTVLSSYRAHLAPTFSFPAAKPCDLQRTTASFARRRSEADCFQKQLWGDTLKLFRTCARIFKCKQNLHQNAVGHPTACRMQARSADFTSLEAPVKSAHGISSGLQELLAAKGIFQRNPP